MVISVSGPSFAGKTYLVSSIIDRIPDLKVINFEKHLNRKDMREGYLNFYRDILSYKEAGHHVICESVYSPETSPAVQCKFDNILNVICLPGYLLHHDHYKAFLRKFGWDTTKKRLGGYSLEQNRESFIKALPSSYVRYNGINKEEIIDIILNKMGE